MRLFLGRWQETGGSAISMGCIFHRVSYSYYLPTLLTNENYIVKKFTLKFRSDTGRFGDITYVLSSTTAEPARQTRKTSDRQAIVLLARSLVVADSNK